MRRWWDSGETACRSYQTASSSMASSKSPGGSVPFVNWATGLAMPWIKYRCVTVTDDAIYVLDSPRLSGGARPTSVISVLPHRTRLGPVSDRWGEITLLEKRHWVKKWFQGEVTAADAEAGLTG